MQRADDGASQWWLQIDYLNVEVYLYESLDQLPKLSASPSYARTTVHSVHRVDAGNPSSSKLQDLRVVQTQIRRNVDHELYLLLQTKNACSSLSSPELS